MTDIVRSDWHHPPYRFDWEINPGNLADARVRLAPIRLQVSVSEDELEDVGVEQLVVSAPELARYGISVERPVQLSETTWAVELRVANARTATKRLRHLDGKVLRLNVALHFEGDQETSIVEVRTLLR